MGDARVETELEFVKRLLVDAEMERDMALAEFGAVAKERDDARATAVDLATALRDAVDDRVCANPQPRGPMNHVLDSCGKCWVCTSRALLARPDIAAVLPQ